MKVVHVLIFGKVHGVGFRKFVKQNASKLGLVGWVRNLPEGIHSLRSGQAVEAEVSGPDEAIQHLVQLTKKGPFLAEVTHVEMAEDEKDFPYTDFIVRHDIE
jgi:acylphosphatase